MTAARIRLAAEADADAIAAIYRPIVAHTTISFETVAPGRDEMAERIRQTLRWYPWLVCDIGGEVTGYAYGSRHRVRPAYQWSVDVSVYVADAFRRRGIAQGLYGSLFRILAAQGFANAFAGIALPNPASVALHEAVGFEPVGVYRRVGYKLGAWHDTGWWQLRITESTTPPDDPLDLQAVQSRADWPSLLAYGEVTIR